MFKTLKFKGNEENFWGIGDTHFRHSKNFILEPRQFKSVEEHDSTLISRWNNLVKPTDTIFHLGDFVFNDPTGEHFMRFCNVLNFCNLFLLKGNHVSGHLQTYRNELRKQFPNSVDEYNMLNYEVYPLELKLNSCKSVFFLPEYAEIEINGQQVVLSHYALRSWNNMARGSETWHGHEHGGDPRSSFGNTTNGKIVDLSIENSKGPISFGEIRKIMDKKAYVSVGHH